MADVDGFVADVGVVAPKARDLLHQSELCVRHQFLVTPFPEFVSVTDSPRHTTTGRLKSVFGHELRAEWREFSVPVDDLVVLGVVEVHAARDRLIFVSSASSTFDRTHARLGGPPPLALDCARLRRVAFLWWRGGPFHERHRPGTRSVAIFHL